MRITGGRPGEDELLVVHNPAVNPIEYVNDGNRELILIKFFGPDLNPDSPAIPKAVGKERD